jgi:hypothetical protein
MAIERRKLLLLAALVIVLVIAVYRMWPATSTAPTAASKSQDARGGSRSAAQAQVPSAPDVHLEALDAERPKPGPPERDLFRFRAVKPPPSEAPTSPRPTPAEPAAPAPTGPPPPPPVPPIALKFIGIMGTETQKIAVLSDGHGAPFYGREGEIVEGRYRILRIGVESIDIAYADGRGRQTIRLTGQ